MIAGLFFPLIASGATIVDTGQPLKSDKDDLGIIDDKYAAQFDINQPYTLTDIRMFFGSADGGLNVKIYGDGGDIPDTSNQLFSQPYTVYGDFGFGWRGPSGLNWTLSPGTYWVAFEFTDTFTSSIAAYAPAPFPLGNEAIGNNMDGYSADGSLDYGVKIEGNMVPAPSSLLILFSGLVALPRFWRKQRN